MRISPFTCIMPACASDRGTEMTEHYIAWWNVENLFDTSTSATRPDWLQKKLSAELKGWTAAVLDRKCKQLARVINVMNDGAGPDILGVCEVESKSVLDKLVASLDLPDRDYGVRHHDTSDARGIDVAFIFDQNKFTADTKIFDRVILKRNATRDIVQANFKSKAGGNDLILIGNHWPSRLGGRYESEPYRILAAETLSYWLDRIPDFMGFEAPVVVMGDFNDDAFDRSITDYALGVRDKTKVASKRSTKPYLYNPSWKLYGENRGTHYFDHWGVLDQIMVNRPLVRTDSKFKLVAGSFNTFAPDFIFKNNKPRRFSRPAKKDFDREGFSDHLPVFVKIKEV